ncbi:hypothetical protein [Streptomyces broussonetiae]|uniref:Uncharacterized protein n=1 Tax=Streptomyces broussonetiae TaxID=2686304 RepID=A0ABV5EBX7_9ACTN
MGHRPGTTSRGPPAKAHRPPPRRSGPQWRLHSPALALLAEAVVAQAAESLRAA